MKTLKEICNVNIPNSLHLLLEASILGDIEDTIEFGDDYANKRDIAEWINDNLAFVTQYDNYPLMDALKNIDKLRINNKYELDLFMFKAINFYCKRDDKVISHPTPEYIKFNNVKNFDVIGNKHDLSRIQFDKLPHINNCGWMFLKNWYNNEYWNPDLSKLNIDNICIFQMDICGLRPTKWPKSKISNFEIVSDLSYVDGIYNDKYLEKFGANYDIQNLNGLKTNNLIVPDFIITEDPNLFDTLRKVDTVITKTDNEHEWNKLDVLFKTNSFKKVYLYNNRTKGYLTDDSKCYEIKKSGNDFIVKARGTNFLKNMKTN